MSVLPTCMSIYHVYTWYPCRPEEAAGCPRTRVIENCELRCGFWESNTGCLEEQQVLSEPSLQLRKSTFDIVRLPFICSLLFWEPHGFRQHPPLCRGAFSCYILWADSVIVRDGTWWATGTREMHSKCKLTCTVSVSVTWFSFTESLSGRIK